MKDIVKKLADRASSFEHRSDQRKRKTKDSGFPLTSLAGHKLQMNDTQNDINIKKKTAKK